MIHATAEIFQQESKSYICQACTRLVTEWERTCPYCGINDELIELKDKFSLDNYSTGPEYLESVSSHPIPRISSGLEGLDWVHCANRPSKYEVDPEHGIPQGTCTIIGGAPSIGKSTLLAQVMGHTGFRKCMYFSGEEAKDKVADRIKRVLGKYQPEKQKVILSDEVKLETMRNQIEKYRPDFCVVDSIQKVWATGARGPAGGIVQIRHFCQYFIKPLKSLHVTLYIVGQITKDGSLAGPKSLEHEVDIIHFMDGDITLKPRRITCFKNRFGESGRSALFFMEESGLVLKQKMASSKDNPFEDMQ